VGLVTRYVLLLAWGSVFGGLMAYSTNVGLGGER
jgi:hypothetical protein